MGDRLKMWMYLASKEGEHEPRPINTVMQDLAFVVLPDGTRLYCKDMDGARAVTAIMRLFVVKQEAPEKE